jgi:hypothetical protein
LEQQRVTAAELEALQAEHLSLVFNLITYWNHHIFHVSGLWKDNIIQNSKRANAKA